MKDLFGNDIKVHDNIKQKKKAIKIKLEAERQDRSKDVSELGLNAIWKVFGNWITKERSNKTQ